MFQTLQANIFDRMLELKVSFSDTVLKIYLKMFNAVSSFLLPTKIPDKKQKGELWRKILYLTDGKI